MAPTRKTAMKASALAKPFQSKVREANEMTKLALIYINDGALGQGGRLLAQAGLLFTEASELRTLALMGG
jgi:hypothetical protein